MRHLYGLKTMTHDLNYAYAPEVKIGKRNLQDLKKKLEKQIPVFQDEIHFCFSLLRCEHVSNVFSGIQKTITNTFIRILTQCLSSYLVININYQRFATNLQMLCY